MMIFLSSVFFLCVFLPVLYQPLSLGIFIMFLTFIVSMVISFVGHSIYAFILFVVFVGGLLVMFGYVVVLIPNMVFSYSYFFFCFFFCMLFVWTDFNRFSDSFLFYIFSDFSFFLYLGLVIVLLFCLIVVVKVCYFHSGSLRPFFICS